MASCFCVAPDIRWVNVLATLPLPLLYLHLLQTQTTSQANGKLEANAMSLSTFPLPLFFSFLYYTDNLSLLFVLLALSSARRGSHISAALVCSCLWR